MTEPEHKFNMLQDIINEARKNDVKHVLCIWQNRLVSFFEIFFSNKFLHIHSIRWIFSSILEHKTMVNALIIFFCDDKNPRKQAWAKIKSTSTKFSARIIFMAYTIIFVSIFHATQHSICALFSSLFFCTV